MRIFSRIFVLHNSVEIIELNCRRPKPEKGDSSIFFYPIAITIILKPFQSKVLTLLSALIVIMRSLLCFWHSSILRLAFSLANEDPIIITIILRHYFFTIFLPISICIITSDSILHAYLHAYFTWLLISAESPAEWLMHNGFCCHCMHDYTVKHSGNCECTANELGLLILLDALRNFELHSTCPKFCFENQALLTVLSSLSPWHSFQGIEQLNAKPLMASRSKVGSMKSRDQHRPLLWRMV